MHALRRCCDMQTCAKYAQPTSVTELELRRCSAFYAGTTPHASSQSCQRSLAAAAKSVDEYDAIEQHRRCSRRGEAGCRTRDQKVRCVALTRPREGRRGAREFWTAITRIVPSCTVHREVQPSRRDPLTTLRAAACAVTNYEHSSFVRKEAQTTL